MPAFLLATGLCFAVSAEAPRPEHPTATARSTPVPVTAQEVRSAAPDRILALQSVRIHGVVTFVHATEATLFVHDDTGQLAIGLVDRNLPLPTVGEVVTVVGSIEPGPRVPRVRATSISPEARGALPLAPEISFAEALSGAQEHQWVKTRGHLLRNESFADWQRLTLGTPDGEFTVSIRSADRLPLAEGAEIVVRGVCQLWTRPGSTDIGGFFLSSPSLDEVCPTEPSPENAAVLTQVVQIRKLRASEAAAGHAVALQGVVTFAHPDRKIFYLHDETGGTLVWFDHDTAAMPTVGDVVSVHGTTSSGAPAPGVRAGQIRTSGRRAPPTPRPIGLEHALTGAEDGQWVEMRGHLRQVDTLGGWLRLFLTTAAGEITVSIPQSSPIEAKAGSFLVVRGVCQSWKDEHNRIGGFFLYTPSEADLTVAEPPPVDPFAVPEESIANLGLYRPETLAMQQVRLSGTVLHHRPGHSVVVQNDSGIVRAYGPAREPLQPGDRIEVAGVPGRRGNRSVLRGAVYRRVGVGPPPSPTALPPGPGFDAALEDRLVCVEGLLTNLSSRPGHTRLLLQTEGAVVEAVYPESFSAGGGLRLGSRLLVTGLYRLVYDEGEEPAAFSIELRSPADLVLRERPPWWTTRRALSALGGVALCFVVGLAWVSVLRRQLRRQAAVLRRQMEKEAALNARHREIVENASDLIFSTDLSGRLTSFNPAGERLTGLTPTAALALGLGDLIAAPDTATLPAFLAQAAVSAQAPAATFETRLRARGGRTLWVEISARPMREAGRVTGLLGIARDITTRKQMEEMNRQMQKAESLGRMAAAIAHHFNNQIQAVLMGLELVRLEIPHSPASHEILAAAERSARQAAEIGSLMLTYLGQASGERTPVDLAAHGRTVLERWRPRLRAGVKLVELLPAPGPLVRADAAQLHQALLCLLANAEEALGDCDGVIRVESTTVDAGAIPSVHRFPIDFEPLPGPYACLLVDDTGGGITEQDLGRIFDPFFTTKFHGRGKGLAIVLGIVRAHDGAVVVDSQPGRGSTFRVFLPLAPATRE